MVQKLFIFIKKMRGRRLSFIFSFFVFSLAIVFALIQFSISADWVVAESSCDYLKGDKKVKCQENEDQYRRVEQLRYMTLKNQNTLENQIALIDLEQSKIRKEMENGQLQLEELDKRIVELNQKIIQNQKMIDHQRKILAGLIQTYYESYQQGVVDLIMTEKDFSESLSQGNYVEQSSLKTKEVLGSIQEARDRLKREEEELEQKKKEIETLKKELDDRNYYLQASEDQKNSLLAETQGKEKKYRQMLERLEMQKLELFNFSEAGNADEIAASVKNYPKPGVNYWASTSWYFSQRDSRWAKKRIGSTTSLMEDYGCAVTSVAMVFKKHGLSIDPGRLVVQKIFIEDFISWPSRWTQSYGSVELVSSKSHGNINWTKVNSEIKNGNPVIVYIKREKGGGHYVVIHNKDSRDYVVHDPYFGSNLYLNTSKSLVGKLGSDSRTMVDQMIIYH